MSKFRVFKVFDGILAENIQWEEFTKNYADILVVCGQGIYEDGVYYTDWYMCSLEI